MSKKFKKAEQIANKVVSSDSKLDHKASKFARAVIVLTCLITIIVSGVMIAMKKSAIEVLIAVIASAVISYFGLVILSAIICIVTTIVGGR